MNWKLLRYSVIILFVFFAAWQLKGQLKELSHLPRILQNTKTLYVYLGLVSLAISYLADGFLSQVILRITGFSLKFLDTLRIAILDIFASQTLPLGDLGVMATTFYFYRKLRVPVANIIFLSFLWGFLSILAFGSFLFVSLPLIPAHHFLRSSFNLAIFLVILTVFGILSLTLVIPTFRYPIQQLISKIIKKPFGEIDLQETFLTNIKLLIRNKLWFVVAILLAYLYIVSQMGILYFSLSAFNLHPKFAVVIFAFVISRLFSWITLAPGGLGASESSLTIILLGFSLEAPSVLAGVLLYRLITFWIPFVLGGFTYATLLRRFRDLKDLTS